MEIKQTRIFKSTYKRLSLKQRKSVDHAIREYVKKASAPYVQWLGQKENPEGAGWATGENYGYDIAGMLQHLLLKEQG